jgi:cytolysin (calcineurin-like family phosphatase)
MPARKALFALLFPALLLLSATVQAAPHFTFFFTADTHYGLDLWYDYEVRNRATIGAMNSLPGTPLPANLGGVVGVPRGVLVGGDLTDTADTYVNFYGIHTGIPVLDRDGFNDDYAVDGSGLLHYPVYEGYGNHDVDNTDYSYTLQGIRERNLVRPDVSNISDNGLNYSWDWEGVHFVNLNIYQGENERSAFSLDFLIQDLAANVGDSGRPIVLMQHFGFDSFSDQWWTPAEQQAYADAINGFNVVGIFHGHLHDTQLYQWNGIDVFMGSSARDGNFLVVEFDGDQMKVAAREGDRWGYTLEKTISVPEPASITLALVAASGLLVMIRRNRAATGETI